MTVNKTLLTEIFRAFHIQRWNDRLRPMELVEMDKHAHKMIIAYCLGKYEESRGLKVDWGKIVKNGVFELLRRIVISDIKSPIFTKIKRNKPVFEKLNRYVLGEIAPKLNSEAVRNEFEEFLFCDCAAADVNDHILEASRIFASFWEFRIIRQTNPSSYQNMKIETELLNEINSYAFLEGVKKLSFKHTISNFVDLCGNLRFQFRWAQTPRVPKTSVLGHSLYVACLSYLFTLDLPNCPKRVYNNFFGGLFHDLPEAATRDIISPVKNSSEQFENLIKEIELEMAELEIYPLIEEDWIDEIKYFTQDEFVEKARDKDKTINPTPEQSLKSYNEDRFSPYDGELVRAADHLSAFVEAWSSCASGVRSDELAAAARKIKSLYSRKDFATLRFSELYNEFDMKNI